MSFAQPFIDDGSVWIRIKDGNLSALSLFDRHYSSKRAHVRRVSQFVGPGRKFVLMTPCARALFVWRKFIDQAQSPQHGINCAVFRNEGAGKSSDLIRAADDLADQEWPAERHYTYVDSRAIKSTNPGYCFIMAGWSRCGTTKGGLTILERLP